MQTKLDSNLDWGKKKVVEAGENGEEKVVYRLVRQNKTVVKESEVERKVVKAPKPKVVAKGTRTIVATASRGSGNGSLRWPVGGPITSRYGPRGGGFHSGLDIGAGTGRQWALPLEGVLLQLAGREATGIVRGSVMAMGDYPLCPSLADQCQLRAKR